MSILFIGPTRLGDAILVSGVLAWLHEASPHEPITVACGAPAAMALANAPGVAALHVMDKRPRGGHWFDLWRAARAQRWRCIVDLRRSLLSWVLRADRRHVIPRGRTAEHRVALASRAIGLPPQPPRLWWSDQHRRRAADLLPDGRPVLALGPGANWICKQWPTGSFIDLAARLLATDGRLAGGRLLLVGSLAEREVARPIFGALAGVSMVDGFGLDIPTTAALLSRCALFVGNDSAMMHLAAASGIPTVGLFGPTRDEHYGPWGPNGLVVRTAESVPQLLARRRSAGPDSTLMDSLDPDRVLAAINARWPTLPRAPAQPARQEVAVTGKRHAT